MAVYRETDEQIVREYSLELEPIVRKESDHALLEFVPTKRFGRTFFIDGQLQFAEKDEYIYHEALVHPCLSTISPRSHVCIIGGGDGLAAREVLRWGPEVQCIDIIDWDKEVTDLFKDTYTDLNEESLTHSKVHIENEDIRSLLDDERSYNCIIIDLLDPNPNEEGQIDLWYDVLFMAKHWILNGGSIVINAGGVDPWNTEILNWLVELVQRKIKWPIFLYKTFVPSFGREWCFILACQVDKPYVEELPEDLKFLDKHAWDQMLKGWTRDYSRQLTFPIQDQLEM